MTTATDIRSIHVDGRRWFDRANGNTYHSARVYVTDTAGQTTTLHVPFQYGYGDQYVQSAYEALHADGILELVKYQNGGTSILWQTCQDRGIELRTTVADVSRRDCEQWGTE